MAVSSKLTDKHLRNLQPGETEQAVGDGGGLWIRVLPAAMGGAINFFYRFTIDGKERRFNCGSYPETSLAQARQARNLARELVAQGLGPVEKAKLDKLTRAAEAAAQKMEKSVLQLFEDWSTIYLAVNRKDRGLAVKSAMERHVLKHIGRLRARDVRIAHVVGFRDGTGNVDGYYGDFAQHLFPTRFGGGVSMGLTVFRNGQRVGSSSLASIFPWGEEDD